MIISEQKRQQNIQSWHGPALRILAGLLDRRKKNLKRRNRDVNNAAVTRDEFMLALVDQYGAHGIYLYHAGVINYIESLPR